MFFKKNRDTIIFGAALLAFTAYVLLDTFLIPHPYESVTQNEITKAATEAEYTADSSDAAESENGISSDKANDSASIDTDENASGSSSDSESDKDSTKTSKRGSKTNNGKHSGKHKRPSSDSDDTTGSSDSVNSGRKSKSGNKNPSSSDETSDSDNKSSDSSTQASDSDSSTVKSSGNSSGSDSNSGSSSDTSKKTTTQSLNLSGGSVIDSYKNDNATITLYEYRVEDTEIYVADVVLNTASALHTAFADQTYGKNVTAKTSEIASDENAVLAINGDFYGAREKGYVIRNGTLYRDSSSGDQEDLVIYGDGSFEVINESSVSADTLVSNGANHVLSFGPALVRNGQVAVSADAEVGKSMASNPRTAIGIVDSLHYVFVVSDGRTKDSEGLSLSELGTFMQGLGVTTAYNLDGGGSSTMYFNGKVINNPTTSGKSIKERSVSDIVYIK